ncbi:hypothetical protein SteCoe_23680 [Stentor coeruleus]|uniref:RING-type domain-containing protein n=1 Tax=Stentor coeruleus TaxID=5963 RepID=A0A1R2BJC2_9CILI|nr:hypothetical protein SteCoe_23680 [Stentor coeruleus]
MNLKRFIVFSLLLKRSISECLLCSIFDTDFIYIKESNVYCLQDSSCAEVCNNFIIPSNEICPRSESNCLTSFHIESPGDIEIPSFPSRNFCSWVLDLRVRGRYYSIFNVKTTDQLYLKINCFISEDKLYDTKEFNLYNNQEPYIINITGSYYEILAISMATENNLSFKLSWNKNPDESDEKEKNTIIILAVFLAIFLMVLLCIGVCLFCIIKKKRANRIGRQLQNYEVVPGDCSFVSNIDTSMPSTLFSSKTLIDPCCVCFERFNFGCFVRELPCKHLFHTSCIDEWISLRKNLSACPLCLKPIFDLQNKAESSINN